MSSNPRPEPLWVSLCLFFSLALPLSRAFWGEADWTDIRGSAFEWTALRELYMSAYTNALLHTHQVTGCNISKGMYMYDPPNQPLGKGFVPACIVEKTLGDRRLGTHIFAGIEVQCAACHLACCLACCAEVLCHRFFPHVFLPF